MDLNSLRGGWYLFEIAGYFNGFDQMVIADRESMFKYYLEPGNNITLHNLNTHSKALSFILLPYLRSYAIYHEIINKLKSNIEELNRRHEQTILNDGIISETTLNCLEELEYSFYISKLSQRSLDVHENMAQILEELLEREGESRNLIDTINYCGKLAVPESWFRENCEELGELVLLRKRN